MGQLFRSKAGTDMGMGGGIMGGAATTTVGIAATITAGGITIIGDLHLKPNERGRWRPASLTQTHITAA